MQPVLVSRFLLNLRSAGTSNPALPTISSDATFQASRFTVPGFRVPSTVMTAASEAIVGNLGETLHQGLDEDDYTGDTFEYEDSTVDGNGEVTCSAPDDCNASRVGGDEEVCHNAVLPYCK